MFFFKRSKTVNSNDECLDKILSILSVYENEMINGKYNLCLTVDFMMFFDDLNRNLNNDLVEETFKNKYQHKVDKLIESFKKLIVLKMTGNFKESFNLKFDLRYFVNLKSLELENIYLNNIGNLNEIIPQLTTIKLNRCLTNRSFEEFFMITNHSWTSLNCLSISRSTFKTTEFDFLPISTKILQLQWNQIKHFNISASTSLNLTELNLSFNKLKAIPDFKGKEPICNTLKILKLKGNLIESLKNIEHLTQLEQLDISTNLIFDRDEISTFLSLCKKLKTLNLIDNPVQMMDDLNVFIIEMFSGLKMLNNQICNQERSIDRESQTSSNVDMFDELDDKNIDSALSKNDESFNSLKASTKKKDRIAVIVDRTDSFVNTDDEQTDPDKLSSIGATKGLSLGLESNFPDLKEIIAEQRKSLGKKLSSKPTNLIVPYSTPVECDSYNIVGELHDHNVNLKETAPFEHQKPFNKSLSPIEIEEQLNAKFKDFETNETRDVLIKAEEDCSILKTDDKNSETATEKEDHEKQRRESTSSLSPKEDNLWANEDMDGENIFLVDKLNSNSIEDADTIFILIKDSLIYEKDCATGKIFETYDLNVITNYEIENESIVTMTFDSKIRAKQKVTYDMDSQLDKFISQFVDPSLSRNKEKANKRFKYECLKCGNVNVQQTECITCKSTALIEIPDTNEQTNDEIDKSASVVQSSFKDDLLYHVKLTSDRNLQLAEKTESINVKSDQSNADDNENKEIKKDEIAKNEPIEEIDDNEKVMNLISSKMESYDLDQFTSIDHELKLYLDVKIFSNNERFEHLFECDFSINDTGEMSHGRIVTTDLSLHLISFKPDYNANDDDSNSAFDIYSVPLNKIKNIKLSRDYFFHQCVWLTIEKMSGKKKKKKHLIEIQTFFIILKDKKLVDLFCNYLENFLNKHQDIKLKINLNTYSLTEKPVKLDTEENIIFSQFIVSLTTKSDQEISKSNSQDLLCLLFEKNCEIILAKCEVIANELKFKKLCRNDLSNLLAAKLESNCKQLHLYFSKDSNNSKMEWIIGSYSVNSMSKMIDLIKSIWETFYKVVLEIHLSE